MRAAEEKTWEKEQPRHCFGIFQLWFSVTTRVWYFQGEMKGSRLCYQQVFVVIKPPRSIRTVHSCVPK